jgi:hypothetical protein
MPTLSTREKDCKKQENQEKKEFGKKDDTQEFK